MRDEGYVAFVAFGTRGDVQPLACLAEHLRRSQGKVVLVTHQAHIDSWLAEEPFADLQCSGVAGNPYGRSDAGADDEHQDQTWEVLQAVGQLRCIVFNLFALEVRHEASLTCMPHHLALGAP